jgi:hypothetical protein
VLQLLYMKDIKPTCSPALLVYNQQSLHVTVPLCACQLSCAWLPEAC